MATPLPELDALADQIRERSEVAFSDLHRAMADRLLSYAFGMLSDRQAAEDAVQQAFIELARAATSFRGDGRALRSWLYRSVRFNCLDEIRRRKRHPERPTDVLPESGSVDIEPDLGFDPQLEAALETLSEKQRSIIMFKHLMGFSGEEIAGILGSNRAAVYASAARAERKLREALCGGKSRFSRAAQCAEVRP